jgi:hypothetical protein
MNTVDSRLDQVVCLVKIHVIVVIDMISNVCWEDSRKASRRYRQFDRSLSRDASAPGDDSC